MPSAREVLEQKVRTKHAAVGNLATEYLRHACKLGASTDGKVAALCRTQLQPFFQLPEDVLTSLELSSIKVRPDKEKARPVLGPVLSPVSSVHQKRQSKKPQAAQIRYYFDQEDTVFDEAFVQFTHSRKKELVVTCPTRTHLRRRRYIRVLGTAISRNMAQYPSFTVRFKPAQLNGIAALACLGFYLVPKTSAHDELAFLVKRAWPKHRKSKMKKLPSAQKYQFATLWVNDRFHASYFDLVKSEFRWAWRDSPFKAEVGTLKRRGTLKLNAVSWPDLQALPLSTKMYGEFGGTTYAANNCFFGTVGDMLSKRALLSNDDAGAKQLDAMSVYYMDPRKPAALTRFLNKREGALLTLLPACLDKLPETALRNFAQVWTDKTINLVKKVLLRDPDFVQTLVAHVPEDLRGDIVPSHGPHSDLDSQALTVAKILAMYPSLTDALNK